MGSSKGSSGNPAAFTGGMPSAPPPGAMTPSSPNVVPSYASFLPSGGGMATPESVAAAYNAAPVPQIAAPAAASAASPSDAITMSMLRQATAPGAIGSQALLNAMLGPPRGGYTDPRQELSAMLAGLGGGGSGGALARNFNTGGYGFFSGAHGGGGRGGNYSGGNR